MKNKNNLLFLASAVAFMAAPMSYASAAPIFTVSTTSGKDKAPGNGNGNTPNNGSGGNTTTGNTGSGGGQTSSCSVSEVSLVIGSTNYAATSCATNVGNGGSTAEASKIATALLGSSGQDFVYLDKTDDNATSSGLGGVEFQTIWTGGGMNGAIGTWTLTWTDVAGSPNLPLQLDLGVGLFGGNGPSANGTAYFFDNVLLPINPNIGSGTFDINFTNNGGNQPTLSHLTLIGGNPTSPSLPPPTAVPEPASMALFSTGLLGLGLLRRRRNRRL